MEGGVVQITSRVLLGESDSGRHHIVLQGQCANDSLYSSCCTNHVAGHGFGAADHRLVCILFAERNLDSGGLAEVVEMCTGAVSVDIELLASLIPSLVERLTHGASSRLTFWVGSRNVVRIASVTIAANLSDDMCPTRFGVLVFF